MRLELWGPRPSLAFVTRKWRDSSSNKLIRCIYWLAEVEPLTVNFKFSCEIEEEGVSAEEIKRCFYYLLSGLDRSYIPSFRASKGCSRGAGQG